MEVSLLLMEQIAQLFIVLLMGYIVVKAKLLKPSDSKVLSVVFVYLIMAIAEVPLKKVFCTLRNYLPVVLRLLVVPVIVLLLLRVVHAAGWISDGKAILMTVYLSAITPSCATVTSMAQLYNRDAAHSSALYVLSTLLSIFTMPLMIGLFEVLI